MLLTVEWCNDWAGRTRLTSQVEWNVGVVEPEAQVVLVGWREADRWAIGWRDRERLFVEDALYGDASIAVRIRLEVGLIP